MSAPLLRTFLMLAMLAGSAVAQQSAGPLTDASLQALSDDFETLAERATPAVVQIVASGYGPIEDGNSFAATVARQRGGGRRGRRYWRCIRGGNRESKDA